MRSFRFTAALAAGKIVAAFCKAFFPKRGSNMPGLVALKFDPFFLRSVKGLDPSKTIFITGTNGKSSSNNMIVHAFKTAGFSVCSNLEGSNMKPGITSAVLKSTSSGGRFKKDFLILEVDERSLAQTASDLAPGHICVTNIQNDQVQRNGDPDYIYQKIKGVVSSIDGFVLYVNNDEPRSKSLGRYVKEGSSVLSFGVAENARASEAEAEWDVTMPCPLCSEALAFTYRNLAGVGAFSCPACGFASDERPDVQVADADYDNGSFRISVKRGFLSGIAHLFDRAADILTGLSDLLSGKDDLSGKSGLLFGDGDIPDKDSGNSDGGLSGISDLFSGSLYHLAYPTAFFLYNYALCACVSTANGIDAKTLKKAFDTFVNVGGRFEEFSFAGKKVRYMRIKQENPETLQSAIDAISYDKCEKAFVVGPAIVDDIVPHYSNTFYTFDCNFGPLIKSCVERYICFGDTISWDMANRLRYAGVPAGNIEIIDTDDDEKILTAISLCKSDNVYLITWIKKYEKLKAHTEGRE